MAEPTQLEYIPNLSLLNLPGKLVAGKQPQVLRKKKYQKNKKVRSTALAIADN
ncbi:MULTISPECIES: hypothetical protein [unclassified Microcoleus]|uniref:hypothetical protein n=1 Tax=unclassified Microcoleus TaxID=2642155 RepID=UPI002FD685B1